MLSFRHFIQEARRNSHLRVQRRINALQRLKKWSKDSKIHISYTSIRKIGINPRSKFPDTPLAVYAYPLKEIWNDIKSEGIRNVRFAANTSKFIFVLQETGRGLQDVSSYTKRNLTTDLQKIRSMVPEDVYIKAEKAVEKIHKTKYTPYKHLHYMLYIISNTRRKSTADMSNILSKLGYVGFSDRKGTGQIHESEEIQSYFLSPKAYKIVDVIEIKDIDIKDEDVRDMADYLRKNASKLSDDEIIKILWKDFSLIRYVYPPRTEVLKVFFDKKQAERWKSKQHFNDDPDYDGSDYSPAEPSKTGLSMIFRYKKLPDDFLEWGVKHSDRRISSAFIIWMTKNRYKLSDMFIKNIIKHNPRILELLTNVNKEIAKELIKHHGYIDHIGLLSKKMKESDLFDVLGEIRNFDPFNKFSKYEPVAKFLYKRLLDKRNPSDNEIEKVASYAQGRFPFMDIVNGLKQNFPDFDFTQVGRWDYWKR